MFFNSVLQNALYKFYNTVARAATIRDGVWIVNWIYWIPTQIHSVTVQTPCI
jgi:hypothetical protein